MISRRNLVIGLCAGGASWAISPLVDCPLAEATSAQALSLRELLLRSRHAVFATPTGVEARWESYAGTRRIVTYTKVAVDQAADGRATAQSELLVRTLGGKVGHIGQLVHGEARLVLGRPALLFVNPDLEQIWRVTGMAQGHYPLESDKSGVQRLLKSPDLPQLKALENAAVRVLPGRTVLEAERLLASELGAAR